jgi:hypothetical protein
MYYKTATPFYTNANHHNTMPYVPAKELANACRCNDVSVATRLCEQYGTATEWPASYNNVSPLYIAASHDNFEMVAYLVSQCFDINSHVDDTGYTLTTIFSALLTPEDGEFRIITPAMAIYLYRKGGILTDMSNIGSIPLLTMAGCCAIEYDWLELIDCAAGDGEFASAKFVEPWIYFANHIGAYKALVCILMHMDAAGTVLPYETTRVLFKTMRIHITEHYPCANALFTFGLSREVDLKEQTVGGTIVKQGDRMATAVVFRDFYVIRLLAVICTINYDYACRRALLELPALWYRTPKAKESVPPMCLPWSRANHHHLTLGTRRAVHTFLLCVARWRKTTWVPTELVFEILGSGPI